MYVYYQQRVKKAQIDLPAICHLPATILFFVHTPKSKPPGAYPLHLTLIRQEPSAIRKQQRLLKKTSQCFFRLITMNSQKHSDQFSVLPHTSRLSPLPQACPSKTKNIHPGKLHFQTQPPSNPRHREPPFTRDKKDFKFAIIRATRRLSSEGYCMISNYYYLCIHFVNPIFQQNHAFQIPLFILPDDLYHPGLL